MKQEVFGEENQVEGRKCFASVNLSQSSKENKRKLGMGGRLPFNLASPSLDPPGLPMTCGVDQACQLKLNTFHSGGQPKT